MMQTPFKESTKQMKEEYYKREFAIIRFTAPQIGPPI